MNPGAVPTTPDELSSSLMTEALGSPVRVTSAHRIGEEYGYAGRSYRVGLEGDGAPDSVVAKLWILQDESDMREFHFYRELATETPVRLPRFHNGAVDVDTGNAWIILETIEGFRQGDDLSPERPEVVLRLVDVVATIHAKWWNRLDDRNWLSRTPRLRRDPAYIDSRRREYLARFGSMDDPLSRALFDAIPTALEEAESLLADAPSTLVHQDLALDNVLFIEPSDEPVLIDWQRCGDRPGAHDLASVLFGIAPLDNFEQVVERYAAGLDRESIVVDADALRRWLGGAMIHMFVTRTLGVARWAADTPRGLTILDTWMARTPNVVAAWQELDRSIFDQILQ